MAFWNDSGSCPIEMLIRLSIFKQRCMTVDFMKKINDGIRSVSRPTPGGSLKILCTIVALWEIRLTPTIVRLDVRKRPAPGMVAQLTRSLARSSNVHASHLKRS